MRHGLFLALFLFARATLFADGYVWLKNYDIPFGTDVYRAHFWPSAPEFRAGLYLVEGVAGSERYTELYPQTSFKSGNEGWGLFRPVVVTVPGKEPGHPVRLAVRSYDGEKSLGQSIIFEVVLGTQVQPAELTGLQSNSLLAGYELFPKYEDFHFQVEVRKGVIAGTIRSILLQEDKRIIVVGDFTEVNGVLRQGIARMLTNGVLDETFQSELPTASRVNAAALDVDGSIFLGGEFQFENETEYLLRLSPTGRVDQLFSAALTNEVTALALQSDGKVLAGITGGDAALLRLNTNGGLDDSFTASQFVSTNGTSWVHAVEVRSTNLIWVGGKFDVRNGVSSGSFVQLRESGEVDSEAPEVLMEGPVYAIGSNLVGGAFTKINGSACSNLVRITDDGLKCNGEALESIWFERSWDVVHAISKSGQAMLHEISFVGGTKAIVGFYSPGSFYNRDATAIEVDGTTAFLGYEGRLKRFSSRITYVDNQLLGLDHYGSFLLLRPKYAWREVFEYSADLKTWTVLPEAIRDTNVTEQARFYRIKPPGN